MAWIWCDQPDDKDRFYATYDYRHSTLRPFKLMGPKRIENSGGVAVLNAKRYTAVRVRKYGCLPAASRERVVHERLREVLTRALESLQLQLYPMTVLAKDAELHEHFAVVPLNEVNCTDIEKSEITSWLIESKVGSTFRTLRHVGGCLGDLEIARDSIFGHVVVSNELKRELENTGEPGLYFLQPEAMFRVGS